MSWTRRPAVFGALLCWGLVWGWGAGFRAEAASYPPGAGAEGSKRRTGADSSVRSKAAEAGLSGFSVPAGAEPYPSRFVAGDAGQEIPYLVDAEVLPAGLARESALEALAGAFAAWEEATGLRFRLEAVATFAGAADAEPHRDGRIRIQLHDLHGRIEDPLALAFGGLFTSSGPVGFGAGGRVLQQEFHRTTAGYVIVNHRQDLLSDPRTLEEVLAHEIGHALGLAHSSEDFLETDPEKTESLMYFQIHADGRGAALTERDRQAVKRAYPEGEPPPPAVSTVLEAVTVSGGGERLWPGLMRAPASRGPVEASSVGDSWQVRLFAGSTTAAYGEFAAEGGDIVYRPLGFFQKPAVAAAGGGFHDRAVYRVESAMHGSAVETVRVLSLERDGWESEPDGLPDSWVERWFGGEGGIPAEGDSDGDGCSELVEFWQNTNPMDGTSGVRVEFAQEVVRVGESAGRIDLELLCSEPPLRPVAVRWTWGGGAQAGADYRAPAACSGGTVVPAGATRWVIPLQLIDDALSEGTESIGLEIESLDGAGFGAVTRVEVVLEDDEDLPVYAFELAEYRAEEGGEIPLEVTVRRSGRIDAGSCVRVRARPAESGAALDPVDDLGAEAREICFAAGETASTLAWWPVDDEVAEPGEAGWLILEPEAGGLLEEGGAEARLEIDDNDGFPLVEFAAGPAREGDGYAEVTVRLLQVSGFAARVDYEWKDGTAREGEDYLGTGGSVEVPAGELEATVRLPLVNDDWSEEPETIRFVVTGLEYAAATVLEAVVQVADDDPLPGLQVPPRVEIVEGGLLRVPVSLSGAAAEEAVFTWRFVAPSEATRGDIPAEGGEVRFLPGQTRGEVVVQLPGDDIDEAAESVRLEWRGAGMRFPAPLSPRWCCWTTIRARCCGSRMRCCGRGTARPDSRSGCPFPAGWRSRCS